MQNYKDYLIVGQGLAGTMLSWFLLKQGKSIQVIDFYNPSSSSQVAAGIIHPVTGRRMVKTWMADQAIPFAFQTYREMEKLLGVKIMYDYHVLELPDSIKTYNDWVARSESAEMKAYINISADVPSYQKYFHSDLKMSVLINQSAWINLKELLHAFRRYLTENKLLTEEKFLYENIILENDSLSYNNIKARKIIFCEGINAMHNPFWKVPFLPAKGEILTIEAEMRLNHIINKKIFILPIGNNQFKVGATYNWTDLTEGPTLVARTYLAHELEQILKIPYRIMAHEAAVRPTVRDRRPITGLHPDHAQIGILNGLGTKGCLLAPLLAYQLSEKL